MSNKSNTRFRGGRLAVLATAGALVLSACGGSAEGGGSDGATEGDSVSVGASMEDYQAAFADLDEVEVFAQSPGAQGSLVSSYFEEYAAVVEEWSDGKVVINLEFSNAVAPPAEVDDAVADGRLDLGAVAPSYEPDKFPASNSLLDLTFNVTQSPAVGAMQLLAMIAEVATTTPEIIEEVEEAGLVPLIPVYTLGLDSLLCSSPTTDLSDMDGTTTRAAARVHTEQVEALGMSAASIDFAELFEGLQRGVVDCSVTSAVTAMISGLPEIVPHGVLDPEVGFAAASAGSLVFGQGTWDELPLPARQLLHDKLDVFYLLMIKAALESYAGMVELSTENDGSFAPFGDQARTELQAANERILQNAREESTGISDPDSFVDEVLASTDRWSSVVVDELGVDPDMGADEFVTWWREADTDAVLEPYVDRMFDEFINDRRPS